LIFEIVLERGHTQVLPEFSRLLVVLPLAQPGNAREELSYRGSALLVLRPEAGVFVTAHLAGNMRATRACLLKHLAEVLGNDGFTSLPHFVEGGRTEHLKAEIDFGAEQNSLVGHLLPGALDAP